MRNNSAFVHSEKLNNFDEKREVIHYFNEISPKFYYRKHIASNKDFFYKPIIELLEAYFPKKSKLNVVDLGCGLGDLEKNVLFPFDNNHNISIVAIDISANMLKGAKKNLTNSTLNIHFIQADAQTTSLIDSYSDITFEVNLIPYIREIGPLLMESHRITKNGGIVFLAFPIKNNSKIWEICWESFIKFHEDVEGEIIKDIYNKLEDRVIYIDLIKGLENLIKIPLARLILLEVIK